MMARRQFLGAGATLLIAPDTRAQSGLWPEWLGSYSGAVRFYRSIPLEDIYPPPEHPHVDFDSAAPFAVYFSVRAEDGSAVVWLRIDGGPTWADSRLWWHEQHGWVAHDFLTGP